MNTSTPEDENSSRGAQKGIKLNLGVKPNGVLTKSITRIMQVPSSKLQMGFKINFAHNRTYYISGFKYACLWQKATTSATTIVSKRQALCFSRMGMYHEPSQFSESLADTMESLHFFVPRFETFFPRFLKN